MTELHPEYLLLALPSAILLLWALALTVRARLHDEGDDARGDDAARHA